MPVSVEDLLTFADSVAANQCDNETWQKFAKTHYPDEIVEAARREIVRICIDDDPNGSANGALTEQASKAVTEVATKLRLSVNT